MKYPFAYTVQGYNEYTREYYLENGIGLCESYSDAAKIIELCYGDELVAIKHLEIYEENTLITLPQKTFDEVINCIESAEAFEVKCDEKGVTFPS